MPIATLAPSTVLTAATVFPLAAVEAILRAELIDAVKAEASIRGVALPARVDDIAKLAFAVDSLLAVSLLCTVESTVGFEVPESVVQMGGYRSVSDALCQLLPRIQGLWPKA